jgi:hypothetical protein
LYARDGTAVEQGPDGSEAFAVADDDERQSCAPGKWGASLPVSVRSDTAVALKEVDDIVDEAVDLALVSARDEAIHVIHTSKFGDPDGLAVARIVVL